MSRRSLILSLALALTAAALVTAQVGTRPPEDNENFESGDPVEQPLPFSHKVHVATGLSCTECHAIEDPGDFAGFPLETKCMACHIAIKTDSPHIEELAAASEAGRPIDWNRVYQVEEFVYFSHEVHYREAEVDCVECHGPVAERDVLFQETSVGMYACMKCHESRGASNSCDLCHDTH